MDKIVVLSGGGQAKVIISILKKNGDFEVAGYVDKVDKGDILGARYLGGDDVLKDLYEDTGIKNAAIGYGQLKDASMKREIVERVARIGFSFPPVISSGAIVNEDVIISKGTVVIDGVVVNSGSRIGEFCLINTKSSVGHDCIIGEYTHVAPGATLTGEVELGRNILVGAGATVIQCRKIVDDVVIGAGAVVIRDIIEPGTYTGVPARKIDQ